MSRFDYETDEEYRSRRRREYENWRARKHEHEYQNGLELLGERIRISDFVKEKILTGRTKVLIIDDKLVLFHKGSTGHWCNSSTFEHEIFLHREIFKQKTGLTEDDLKGMEVHHVDGNKDNNDITNLKLLSKSEHARHHLISTRIKTKKICEWCGEEYETYINKSRFCSSKCGYKWRYHNERKLQLDTRICKNCGKEFTCNKYKPTKFCSLSCATKFRYKK